MRTPVTTQLLDTVDRAVESRWAAARQRAIDVPGVDRDERIDAVTASIRRELGLAGAAAGGTAAVPGVGIGTATAAFMVELGWTTVRLADLILTIASIHGHDRAGFEERRLWVLSILTYRDRAATVVAQLAGDLAGTRNRSGLPRLSNRSLQRINSTIGRTIVARYGTRRGVAAVGRAVPFGIGAALGYGINARAVSLTAQHAHSFFSHFPIDIGAIDVDAVSTRGDRSESSPGRGER